LKAMRTVPDCCVPDSTERWYVMSPNEKPGTTCHADASKSGEIVEPPAFAVTLSVCLCLSRVTPQRRN